MHYLEFFGYLPYGALTFQRLVEYLLPQLFPKNWSTHLKLTFPLPPIM